MAIVNNKSAVGIYHLQAVCGYHLKLLDFHMFPYQNMIWGGLAELPLMECAPYKAQNLATKVPNNHQKETTLSRHFKAGAALMVSRPSPLMVSNGKVSKPGAPLMVSRVT